jgi:hypothetical protein
MVLFISGDQRESMLELIVSQPESLAVSAPDELKRFIFCSGWKAAKEFDGIFEKR